jgi:putative transposase
VDTHPQSQRAAENAGLLKLIRASFDASNRIYGSPRVCLNLREAGETCGKHRVARLMRAHKIRAVRGYGRKPKSGAKPSDLVPNFLQRQFDIAGRIGLGLPTLPTSGPGKAGCTWRLSWICFQVIPSMSRRGNCWDTAVAESFFSSLKKEHIKKKIYKNRSIARGEIAEYIEAFYNPTRRHNHLGGVSPAAFEAAGSRR